MKTLILTASAAALLLTACGSGGEQAAEAAASSEPGLTPLETVKAECGLGIVGFKLGDDGESMTLDMPGEGETGPTVERMVCVLMAANTPDAVIDRMDRTRAFDGMQDATWDDYAATWTYHPDSGLDVILTHDAAD